MTRRHHRKLRTRVGRPPRSRSSSGRCAADQTSSLLQPTTPLPAGAPRIAGDERASRARACPPGCGIRRRIPCAGRAAAPRRGRGPPRRRDRAAGRELRDHHPRLARRQRLRPALGPALRHPRAPRARQRHLRDRRRARPRDRPRDAAARQRPQRARAALAARQPGGERRARTTPPPARRSLDQSRVQHRRLLARPGARGRPGRRPHPRAKRATTPMRRARFLNSLGRNGELALAAADGGRKPAADMLSSHPGTPERIALATQAARRVGRAGRRRRATADAISPSSTGSPMATTPPTGSCAAAVSCIRASASPSRRRKASGSRTPRRRCSALARRQSPASLRRHRGAEGQTLETVLQSAWNDGVETGSVQALTVNGLPAAVATARGKEWVFRLAAIRVGATTYRLVLAARGQPEALERAFRASLEQRPSAQPPRRRGASVRCGSSS